MGNKLSAYEIEEKKKQDKEYLRVANIRVTCVSALEEKSKAMAVAALKEQLTTERFEEAAASAFYIAAVNKRLNDMNVIYFWIPYGVSGTLVIPPKQSEDPDQIYKEALEQSISDAKQHTEALESFLGTPQK